MKGLWYIRTVRVSDFENIGRIYWMIFRFTKNNYNIVNICSFDKIFDDFLIHKN